MKIHRRFFLPSWSEAAHHVKHRCASARDEITRYPVFADDGVHARIKTKQPWDRRARQSFKKCLCMEVDIAADEEAGLPARRVDFPMQADAEGLAQWLAHLGRQYVGDKTTVWYGHWSDAHLQLEERAGGRLLVDVTCTPDWCVPPEWKDAVEVTDDPTWHRPTLTVQTWPATPFGPVEDAAPDSAWGSRLDPPVSATHITADE